MMGWFLPVLKPIYVFIKQSVILLGKGLHVEVVTNAVASRDINNHSIAVDRIRKKWGVPPLLLKWSYLIYRSGQREIDLKN
ncbi:hypothetical protein Ct9H90mP29_19540 [bacterium]|nr:MAG: hypothetical protein Ct9H90mP29_19540 [bacterium]